MLLVKIKDEMNTIAMDFETSSDDDVGQHLSLMNELEHGWGVKVLVAVLTFNVDSTPGTWIKKISSDRAYSSISYISSIVLYGRGRHHCLRFPLLVERRAQ